VLVAFHSVPTLLAREAGTLSTNLSASKEMYGFSRTTGVDWEEKGTKAERKARHMQGLREFEGFFFSGLAGRVGEKKCLPYLYLNDGGRYKAAAIALGRITASSAAMRRPVMQREIRVQCIASQNTVVLGGFHRKQQKKKKETEERQLAYGPDTEEKHQH
jgi:hypothetical protein